MTNWVLLNQHLDYVLEKGQEIIMNNQIEQLVRELLQVAKKYAKNEDVTIITNNHSDNNLQIQVIISDRNELDITLNSLPE
ncbi:hypothetical protein BDD30_3635 [Photorhabdus asymbiotica]|uniref:Uncharacterized protein n=2 Tax=Morganellaceae TaxID=1903414 RepID=A0ABX9SLK8_9GAMM|nr:hypothetical protein BDD30_3635 [Photorhabdus asymbiotica]